MKCNFNRIAKIEGKRRDFPHSCFAGIKELQLPSRQQASVHRTSARGQSTGVIPVVLMEKGATPHRSRQNLHENHLIFQFCIDIIGAF